MQHWTAHQPSNKGQKCLQQVMHPWDVNCPMAVSRRNIGIPQASRNKTYGTKNAPARAEKSVKQVKILFSHGK